MPVLRAAPVRLLDDRDAPEVRALLARDPVANAMVTSRVETVGLEPWRLGAELWGHVSGGRLDALCYAGANLVPVGAGSEALRAFADKARRQGRRCSSIVGPRDMVADLWSRLSRSWGPARDIRDNQPLMALSAPSRVAPDPAVRRVLPGEIEVLLPASIAMFTEEVGVSPTVGDGGVLHRNRLEELISQGRSFARIEDGRVVFKAEIGAVTKDACQVQGVWVHPDLRGHGLSEAGMAAVVDECLRSIAPVVSLYVNDYNAPARRCYERVGFATVGRFMSVLF